MVDKEARPLLVETPHSNGGQTPVVEGVTPVAAVGANGHVEQAVDVAAPEYLMQEITRLRTSPVDVVLAPDPEQPGQLREVTLPPERQVAERNRRNVSIIELAQQIVAKTHAEPLQEQLFNNAIAVLTEARVQLVMAGDAQQGELLAQDAEALYKRDASSFAAVEAGYRTVQVAQSLAQLNPNDVERALVYSRRARLFAERFPQETSRGPVALATAARQCDHLGQHDEARLGYSLLSTRYAGTPFAEQAAGPLRRLDLVGKVLEEFGGETHDGGQIALPQYRGHAVLIVFWSSASVFADQLPALEKTVAAIGADRLAVVGVCLDHESADMERTLEIGGLGWKHIFHHDPNLRGLATPVARYYGVTQVPSYWLVDKDGVVRSIDYDWERLAESFTARDR